MRCKYSQILIVEIVEEVGSDSCKDLDLKNDLQILLGLWN